MNKKVNVLVTGCGGDIGQSIGKILNESAYVNNLSGCDISDKNAARFIFSDFFIGLKCTDPAYLANLERIVAEKDIDIIIPIAEPELRFLSQKGVVDTIGKAKLILASPEAMEVGFDKLKTAQFLEVHNLPFPVTQLINTVDQVSAFPVILKSRTGSGSATVSVVKEQEEFEFLKKHNPDFIVQEYLPGDNEEYTCGVFRSKSGEVRNIILKRTLTGGYSGYGEVIKNNEIESLLNAIAADINLIGSINVQLRLTAKGAVVFEINPRFSSTVLFRHMFGFADLLWCIEDTLDWGVAPYQETAVGKKFYKGFNEYIS
ncbi:ATP-grasp domain-containing protein [Mucilaginibacter phyllosphaerae]|uniref:ATP-grasp domain-containing protein n=1 Tax=Mucilaginibacter phyllosphaerae TaxID=1812349 RepID=A0A4Y8AG26_9SPHI|nr:ATP-grasp domain-containing protein [Mucilaginibacter phyllosphaerae]MBB3968636.1 carbamoyl-phosphate synthase large subunit [Mucilaginibacter phyllosphaerae]TEW67726.1 ATP-grasp domain-containing protein [Mucilaginibacter phyllosphaerae]GGH14789.1 carbamoyl phosphate synthase [Mucilaginibacter phyllosphaerae]